MSKKKWSPYAFQAALKRSGLSYRQLRERLGRALEGPVPTYSTMWHWGQPGSPGPRYASWGKAVMAVLRRAAPRKKR